MLHFHDGSSDFPHGAGASLVGWYVYSGGPGSEPDGPFSSLREAEEAADLPLPYRAYRWFENLPLPDGSRPVLGVLTRFRDAFCDPFSREAGTLRPIFSSSGEWGQFRMAVWIAFSPQTLSWYREPESDFGYDESTNPSNGWA